MKTIVQGKKIKVTYEVLVERDEDGKLSRKPKITLVNQDTEWEDILTYDAPPQGNETLIGEIYLSDDEAVSISRQYFRADLCVWIQRVNKLLEKKDNYKKCEKELKPLLAEYNTQMIEDNPKAKAYCDLHKLNYAETDYEELLKILPESSSIAYEPSIVSNGINNVYLTSAKTIYGLDGSIIRIAK